MNTYIYDTSPLYNTFYIYNLNNKFRRPNSSNKYIPPPNYKYKQLQLVRPHKEFTSWIRGEEEMEKSSTTGAAIEIGQDSIINLNQWGVSSYLLFLACPLYFWYCIFIVPFYLFRSFFWEVCNCLDVELGFFYFIKS
jgi:hypothetical protein